MRTKRKTASGLWMDAEHVIVLPAPRLSFSFSFSSFPAFSFSSLLLLEAFSGCVPHFLFFLRPLVCLFALPPAPLLSKLRFLFHISLLVPCHLLFSFSLCQFMLRPSLPLVLMNFSDQSLLPLHSLRCRS